MEDYCTISIKPITREKLKLIKKVTGKSYDTILNELVGGDLALKTDNVMKIVRNKTALTLRYYENDNLNFYKEEVITYENLKTDPIGTMYTANENVNREVDYVNTICELCFRRGNDVILLVKQIENVKGKMKIDTNVLHFDVF